MSMLDFLIDLLPPGFLKQMGSLVSPEGNRASLSILIYHRVLPMQDEMIAGEVTQQTFDWQMSVLSRYCNVLPLGEAVKRLGDGMLPDRAVSVTFDDGYADNYHEALPILTKYKLPATFFVATGFVDGGIMWNDMLIESMRTAKGNYINLKKFNLGQHSLKSFAERQEASLCLIDMLKHLDPIERLDQAKKIVEIAAAELPARLMMTPDQVFKLMQAGMEIGGHTVTHPILAKLDVDAARSEILSGKRRLEDIINAPVSLFAYPNGKPGTDYMRDHVRIVKELGFSAAVTTAWGVSHRDSDLFQLPRFTQWDKSPKRFMLRMLKNCLSRDYAQVKAW